jgi:hypothetical protein
MAVAALLAAGALGCGGAAGGANGPTKPGRYVLGSVVIDGDGNRTTHVQTIASLDDGPFNKLPDNIKPVDFKFWDYPAHKLWRIELTDPPTAREVDGLPFAAIGFGGTSMGGKLYSGESPDGSKSDVYETDPATNSGKLRFTMDGYFYGLFELAK